MSDSTNQEFQRLRESEAKYRRMIELAGDGIFAISIDDGTIIDLNPKAEELTGRTREELIGLKVWRLHPEYERERAEAFFHEVSRKQKVWCREMHFERPDGSEVIVDVGASRVTYGDQEFIQRICRDVTAQRRLERQNTELREFYEFILNIMPVGLGVRRDINKSPSVEFANRKLKEMFSSEGFREHDVKWYDLDRCSDVYLDTAVNEDGIYVEERSFPEGKKYQFIVSYYRDREFSWRELMIVQDVTERRRLRHELEKTNEDLELRVEERTRELREKQAQLAQSEKMASLGSLVAGVAHEINTPLGALKSNTNMFLRSVTKIRKQLQAVEFAESDKVVELLDRVDNLGKVSETAAERISSIVNTLRSFARLDRTEKDRVDIHEGLESTLTLVHHELKGRIEVEKDFADLPPIKCFPNQLNQVFMNILINAVHAIKDKGKITLRTRRVDDNRISITISDTGVGISQEDLSRIYDPGFTTKGTGVGTGLGLSIVRQIVDEHDGSIQVDSEERKGTAFTIELPIE